MKDSEIHAIVKATVAETLIGLGLTAGDPVELQKDFIHLRNLRQGCEATRRNIIKAVITVTIPAALYIIWVAVKSAVLGVIPS